MLRIIALLGLILALSGCGAGPDLGSEEGVRIAEALYTAVTSKRSDLLDQSEARLRSLQGQSKISSPGFERLTKVIAKARGGDWQAAAKDLDRVLRAQAH